MSNPLKTPPNTGENRLKRKVDVLTEAPPVIHPQDGEGSPSFTEMETGQPKRIKLSARALLATLSRRRIAITEIKFSGHSSKDGGTYADVAVATLVKTSGSCKERRRTVAVKKLRFVLNGDVTEEKFLRAFVNELLVLDKLSHPNVVKIIGFVEDIENRIAWLVFPWEDNGNLREFLRSGKWELPERVSLIQDVARGLEYLHTQDPPICHGDLKSASSAIYPYPSRHLTLTIAQLNILVNSEHHALITDFGSARVTREIKDHRANTEPSPPASASRNPPKTNDRLQFNLSASDTTLTLTGPQCSFRWAPPEVLNGGPLDLASDIWALGWIAWEAITDNHPFEELNLESAVIMRIIEGQLPLLHNHGQLSQIRSLCSMMLSCWKPEPRERPSATECRKSLRWIPSVVPMSKDGEQSTGRPAMIFLRLGEIHRLQGKHEEATEMYEQGLAVAQSTGDQTVVARLLLQLAETQRTQYRFIGAEAFYTKAMAICGSIGDDRRRASALYGLGEIQRARFNFVDAEASYTQAMSIYARIGNDRGRADALLRLGEIQRAFVQYDIAKPASSGPASSSPSSPDLGLANALRGLGDIQRARRNYVDAEASYTQAMSMYARIGNDQGRADTLVGLGKIQRELSNYVDAEASYTQAMTIFTSIGNDQGRADALDCLGDIQRARSNYVDAEASYTQAMAVYVSTRNMHGRANALLGLGDVQRARSNYVDAEASFTQAMAICARIGNEHGRADALLGLGNVHRARSNYVDGEAFFSQAMAIYASIRNEHGRADALVGLGDVQQARSNYVDAEASYTQAMAIYASIGNEHGRADALLKLGNVQRARSNYVDAEASYTQAMAIYASIGNEHGLANALLKLGHVQRARSNYVDAELSYTQTMTICAAIGDDVCWTKSSLALSRIQFHQARYLEAKVLLKDAARISDRIHYVWGKRVSNKLLKEVLKAETSATEPRLPPPALPHMNHAEDTAVVPLSVNAPDMNTSDSAALSL